MKTIGLDYNVGLEYFSVLVGFLMLQYCVYPAIDAPGGFLFEWWSVFWDIFIARTNEKHSDAAASYLEASNFFCR